MTDFTKEQLQELRRGYDISPYPDRASLAAFALAQMERAEGAEAMLEKWETEIGALMPKDFKDWHENAIEEHPMVAAWCLKGQRENANHAWELTQKHLDLLHAAEAERDRLKKELDGAEAERDEARALKVPPSVDELLLAQMAAKVAETERDLAQRELADAESELRSFFNGTPEGPAKKIMRRWPAVRRALERREL